MGFNEANTVQAAIIGRMVGVGWNHIPGEALDRHVSDVFLKNDLRAALIRLNPEIAQHPERADQVIGEIEKQLQEADGLLSANEVMTQWLLQRRSIRYQGQPRVGEAVRLVDFDNPTANTWIVADEVSYPRLHGGRRLDVVGYLNGIPLVIGEAKTMVREGVDWLQAVKDLRDYQHQLRPLFAPNLLMFACDGRQFRYGALGADASGYMRWGPVHDEHSDRTVSFNRCLDQAAQLLAPAQILNVLRHYVLYGTDLDGERAYIHKILPRYPQVEACDLLLERAADPTKKQALVWHHQGSGKTLLMAFTARRLWEGPQFTNPLVLAVLDRVDLVEQMASQFHSIRLPFERVSDIATLRSMVDGGQSGLIVTTIHKFKDLQATNPASNVFVLVDECHRTQEGKLGAELKAALPQAHRFGFTGTPVSDKDHDTRENFGLKTDNANTWALHHYSVEQSLADGMTLPIHIEPHMISGAVDQEVLDSDYDQLADDANWDDDTKERVSRRASTAVRILSAPERVNRIADDIVDHYLSHIEHLGYKAQVVVFDRRLCVQYERAIRQRLAARDSIVETAVVMTASGKETEYLPYNLAPEQEAQIKARFRDHRDPLKILIVTAKLLTGFDAPVEGVMYVDKPMRLHTLFQAIARTNRCWTNPDTGQVKDRGLVVDYIGLGYEIKRSLLQDYGGPIWTGSRDELHRIYDERLAELARPLPKWTAGYDPAQWMQDAHEALQEGSAQTEFREQYRTLASLVRFLKDDPYLRSSAGLWRNISDLATSLQPEDMTGLLMDLYGVQIAEMIDRSVSTTDLQTVGATPAVDLATINDLQADREPIERAEIDSPEALLELLDRPGPNSGPFVYTRTLSQRLQQLLDRQIETIAQAAEFMRELVGSAPAPATETLSGFMARLPIQGSTAQLAKIAQEVDEVAATALGDNWVDSKAQRRAVERKIKIILRKQKLNDDGLVEAILQYVVRS